MSMKRIFPLFALLVGLAMPTLAGTTGKISGTVLDKATGEPLVGVNVIVVGKSLGAASDIDGHFFILNVPPGTYTLRVAMMGYADVVATNLQVDSDHTTEVNFELELATLQGQEVVVTITRPLIQRDLTSSEVSISGDQIANMPVLNISDILNLQAGVVDGHFRGGRSSEVSYMIDGVPINDVFSSDAALFVENNIVQELKVISGTFNAEYGRAQSGIVDIITKNGSDQLKLSAGTQTGDYVSSHDNIFWNIGTFNPLHYVDNTLFLSGPLGSRLNYLVSAEKVDDEGYLYGIDNFSPTDVGEPGDSSFVPMAFNDRLSIFSKLSLSVSTRNIITLSVTYQQRDQNRSYGIYDHLFRYNPRGMGSSNEQGLISVFNWNHIFSAKSYLNLRASLNAKDFSRHVYPDSLDSRYSTDSRLRMTGNFAFHSGGTEMTYFRRSTRSQLVKGDFTSQLNKQLQVQFGGSYLQHQLKLHDIVLKKNAETAFEVTIPPLGTADNQQYLRKPVEAAVYAQSKWESDDFILNLGIRLDYFDARDSILTDLTRPRTTSMQASSTSYQLSPRLGIAYPISDRGVMHVSYGYFFQIPSYEFLYANPNHTVNPEEGRAAVLNDPFGNAELLPQKTISYEIGLQQQLTHSTALDVTAYYKDIRNLLGSELNTIAPGEDHAGIDYGRYVNRDYGQVKGLTFSFEQRMGGGMSANVDYTYQVARGNASDPKSTLIDNQSDPPVESEKQLVPLNWDRTHSVNVQLSLQPNEATTLTLIGVAGTGFPYTPDALERRSSIENSARKPGTMTFDAFLSRKVSFGPFDTRFSVQILNLFDRLNERDVYGDTGRSTYTTELFRPGEVQGANTKEEFFTRPDWYGPPRQILVSMKVDL